MSDPVSNVEIEDVLSSIRRLVSDTSRQAEEAPTAKPEPEQTDTEEFTKAATDRLVLTPSLRVTEEPMFSQEQGEEVNKTSPEVTSETFVATVETTELEVDDFVFSHVPFSESAVSEQEEKLIESAQKPVEEEAQLAGDPDLDSQQTDTPEDEFEGYPLPDPDSRILRWESMTRPAIEPYEPDEPGDSDYAGTNVQPIGWKDAADDHNEALADADADRIEAEAIAYTAEAIEENYSSDLTSGVQDEAVTIDEAMLREMVADIVRQELQGALGERITRNVRKLVRREIHRALAAHDLG